MIRCTFFVLSFLLFLFHFLVVFGLPVPYRSPFPRVPSPAKHVKRERQSPSVTAPAERWPNHERTVWIENFDLFFCDDRFCTPSAAQGARRLCYDGLDGTGAGARDYHHLRSYYLRVEGPPYQHNRHPRPRGLHA